MCGIFFACSRKEHIVLDDAVQNALRARGPDSLEIHHIKNNQISLGDAHTRDSDNHYYLTFASSVLSLRGDHICHQPLIDATTGSIFCWNGEAWKIDHVPVRGNDTEQVFKLLLDASNNAAETNRDLETSHSEIVRVLTRIAGPYAFVYYDAVNAIVYYGRDRLGRRSLILDSVDPASSQIMLCSFSPGKQPAVEVVTDGIHYLDLNEVTLMPRYIPWTELAPAMNNAIPDDGQDIAAIPSVNAVAALKLYLSESIRLRVLDVPTYTPNQIYTTENPSRVAILFSGGLDCTLLARLAHDVLPIDQPIDLLNVAFENPRTVRAAAQASKKSINGSNLSISPYETCPDRITGRSSFAELVNICAARTWRFVAIDVPYSDTLQHRATVIRLMAPHNTEMDLSITLALYFASHGQGQATTSPSSNPIPYTTTSRVLLSGLGADELFAGYARHAAAFTRANHAGLIEELNLDFTRIGTRNLGRDDRVMAHWGREIRYPYLDEDFVQFALGLPVWEKTGFRVGRQVKKHFEDTESAKMESVADLDPAKMILRILCWELGVRGAAGERKRAIQFGARTAKMEGGRTKGTDLLVVEDGAGGGESA